MFIAYLLIDSVYKGDQSKMDHYQEKLQSLLLHTDEGILATFVIMYVTTVVKTLVFKMLRAKKRDKLTLDPDYKGLIFFSHRKEYF